jgi:hypothetical protein
MNRGGFGLLSFWRIIMLVKAKRLSDGKTVWVNPESVTDETHELGEVKATESNTTQKRGRKPKVNTDAEPS